MTTPHEWLENVKSHLPPHLHGHLHVNDFGVLLHHPFRIVPSLNAMPHEWGVGRVESDILAKQGLFTTACEAGDWHRALFIVERPYRAEYLADLMQKHGVERLITAVNYVWTDAENVSNDGDAISLWQDIWQQVSWTRQGRARKRRFHVMEPAERELFDALPDRLTVYRGYSIAGNEHGYSWTLDRNKAEWFARRYAGSSEADGVFVASVEVNKNEVLAYFTGRNEAEIVLDIWGDWSANMQIETLSVEAAQAA